MACSAASGDDISTNPKPRDRPVSRSVITAAESTPPYRANASRRRSVEVENESPPTNNLTDIEWLLSRASGQPRLVRSAAVCVMGEHTTVRPNSA
jgi:hypothetical protein